MIRLIGENIIYKNGKCKIEDQNEIEIYFTYHGIRMRRNVLEAIEEKEIEFENKSIEEKLHLKTNDDTTNNKSNTNKKNDKTLIDDFYDYLVECGYKLFTPTGLPSTASNYIVRLNKVCSIESINLIQLAKNIDYYVKLYDFGGSKEDFGNTSHRAVINALKRFQEFLLHVK